uniref:Uncharacterized protein n=1 Tax=Eucampia antarctica TaxID=49252 RepID=A0A7S2WKA9_9STRA|mmetsp:Transcript_4018/g.3786  ORF Transcript_4018/g.3786 Transcript_4018/m.3786 type:complete len:255 (+) Transcript_4018:109-873(+)
MIGVDRSYIVMRESNCRIEITGLHEHCSPLIFFSSLENGSNYHNIGNGLKEESFYLNRQYTSKLNSSVCDELPDLTAIATRSPILTDDSNFVSTFTHFFNSSHSNSAIKCEHDQQEETHQYPYETIFDDRCCSLAITTSHHHCPIISDDKSTNPLKVYDSEDYACDISCNVRTIASNLTNSASRSQPKQGIDHYMAATWKVLAQRRKSRLLSIKRKRIWKKRMSRMLLLPMTILCVFILYGNFLQQPNIVIVSV